MWTRVGGDFQTDDVERTGGGGGVQKSVFARTSLMDDLFNIEDKSSNDLY